MRLFIAADTSQPVREECIRLVNSLNETGADLRPVAPENLHVTLKFLGEIREDCVKNVERAVLESACHTMPFTVRFSVMGYFGGTRFPRTIWLGPSLGRDSLIGLSESLNEKLSWARNEGRKPKPHLTLARVRTPVNAERLVEAIRSMRDVKIDELDVKEIMLMKSVLRPDGPEYTVVSRFPLGS